MENRFVTVTLRVMVHENDQTWRSTIREDDELTLTIPAGAFTAIDYGKLIGQIYSRASNKYAETKREQQATVAAATETEKDE